MGEAKAHSEKATTEYEDNEKDQKALAAKIKQDEAVHSIHKQTAEEVAKTEAPATQFGHEVKTEQADAIKIATGQAQGVSDVSTELIQNLGNMIAGHSVTIKDAALLVAKANANSENLAQAVTQMGKTADSMRNYSEATAQKLKEIMTFMNQLESRIEHMGNMGKTH